MDVLGVFPSDNISTEYSKTRTSHITNLDTYTPSNYVKTPIIDSLKTPSNYPRTPILDTLSTPSDLSEVDEVNFYPRPLNPIYRDALYPRPFNPINRDALYPRPLNPINRNEDFGSINTVNRAMSKIPKTPRLDNLSTSYTFSGQRPFVNTTQVSSNYVIPGQFSYLPPTDYNYEYIYDPLNSPNYENYRNRVIQGTYTNVNEVSLGIHKEVVPYVGNSEIVLNTTSKKGGTFKLCFKLIDNNLNKIEKVFIKYHDLSKRKIM